ncbi:Golgi SNAP receptor complex member 2-like [Pomacea canaliculata]|uniref:Golgi SNAP receptor complex member 2-like n=1 Tax=Pomacea canaliculata TaxID=400727 RepID=UPI000D726BCA|nr:Golgi SNAP receptor complex member 2-like [Pomacea canaliculata]
MEALYHQTNALIQEVQRDLGRLERTSEDKVHTVENEIQTHLDHVIGNCERLEILVNKEPPTRRANAKMRVDQLKYDCQHVQAALRNLQHKRYMRAQEEQEREALLSRTFTTNDQQDTSIYIDPALQHHSRLTSAHKRLDDFIEHGSSMLSNLRSQGTTLKGVHRRILDIANTLGLTNTVMRLIERRTAQDKIILVVGMVVTVIIMYLVWQYFT